MTSLDESIAVYGHVMPKDDQPKQAPNSRKGIPNGKSKHYGDRDERFTLDMDPEEAVSRLVKDE